MKVSAEFVKAKIAANPKHSVLIAEDLGPGNARLSYLVGDARALQAEVDLLESSIATPYRVRLQTPPRGGERGRKSAEESEFVFILPGMTGFAPAAPVPTAAPAQPVNGNQLAQAERLGRAEAEREAMAQRLEALEKRLEEMESDPGEDESAEAEPVNAAPAPLKFWETPEFGKQLMDLGKMAAARLLSPTSAPVANAPAPSSVPATVNAADPYAHLTDEERRVLAAVKNCQAHDPETWATIGTALLDTYAAIPNPATNGQA